MSGGMCCRCWFKNFLSVPCGSEVISHVIGTVPKNRLSTHSEGKKNILLAPHSSLEITVFTAVPLWVKLLLIVRACLVSVGVQVT